MGLPLPSWAKVDSFRQQPHQRVVDAVNELGTLTTPGTGGQVLRTPFGTAVVPPNVPPATQSPLARVIATSTNSTAGLINCKTVTKDTTTAVGDEFPVQMLVSHAVGGVFYAVKSQNGTDHVGVDWIEYFSALPLQQYYVLTPIDATLLPVWTDPKFGL